MKKEKRIERGDDGHLYVVQGRRRILMWTPQMLSDLRRYYPDTPNKEMEEIMGIKSHIIIDKAHKIGVYKSSEFLTRMRKEQVLLMRSVPKSRRPPLTPEQLEKMTKGRIASINRKKQEGTYVNHNSKPVYCVEDKAAYPSIKLFFQSKGIHFCTDGYSRLKRFGRYKGYTLIPI